MNEIVQTDRTPKSGEIYRHFKNKLYQVIAVAAHSETGEQLVIYQALYGDFGIFARPLHMFTGEVDCEKYPDVKQRYRFERVGVSGRVDAACDAYISENTAADSSRSAGGEGDFEFSDGGDACSASSKEQVNSKLMAFLDADSMEEKYNILVSMRDTVTDMMINNLAVVLDVVIEEGDLEVRYEELKRCLRTRQRYESGRLR